MTLAQQIAFIKAQLDDVEIGRMPQATGRMIPKFQAVLETLKWVAKLEPALKVIRDCTNKEQVRECIHCKSVAMALEEIMVSLSK